MCLSYEHDWFTAKICLVDLVIHIWVMAFCQQLRSRMLDHLIAFLPITTRYINEDTTIVPMLKMLRASGRTTFLVTNRYLIYIIYYRLHLAYGLSDLILYFRNYVFFSLWDYTNVVMNFLCESQTMEGSEKCNFDWLQYFDVVITGRLCSFLLHIFCILLFSW